VVDDQEPAPESGTPPVIAPAELNSARFALVGLALFTVATIVLLPFYDELGRHHHRIWLWTSIAGIGVGLFGFALSSRHRIRGRTK
jgi:hypothetical protein